MFNLSKSFEKLKSFLEENDLKVNSEPNNLPNALARENAGLFKKSKNKIKNKISDKITEDQGKRGVIMIKNFPHGFYEKQMFEYFSQFGEVTRLKIVRSRKTGKPRNYGFIEFRFKNVAQIAAETMNNYLMFDKIVKCKVLTEENIKKNIFKNWDRPFISSVEKHKTTHNKIKTNEQELRSIRNSLRRIKKMQNTLLEQLELQFKPLMINKPTNLQEINKRPPKESLIPEVQISMPTPKMSKFLLMNKRRLIIPRFWKLKAGAKFRMTS